MSAELDSERVRTTLKTQLEKLFGSAAPEGQPVAGPNTDVEGETAADLMARFADNLRAKEEKQDIYRANGARAPRVQIPKEKEHELVESYSMPQTNGTEPTTTKAPEVIPRLPQAPPDGSSDHGTNDVLYGMPPGGAPRIVTPSEVRRLNQEGWAIFFTPNLFDGRRTKANCKRLRFWFTDIDGGDKPAQLARIRECPLPPTYIVESRAGYHVYFAIKGEVDAPTWQRIEDAVVFQLEGDGNARDIPRLLRVPGYDNHKGATPFRVTMIDSNNVCYTPVEMIAAFKIAAAPSKQVKPKKTVQVLPSNASLQSLVNEDHQLLLERLSGRAEVRHETYDFQPQPNGNRNLHVNGNSTSFFVTPEGSLRSGHQACKNILDWLAWFGHTPAEIETICREVFADLLTTTDSPALRASLERLARLDTLSFEIVREEEAQKLGLTGAALNRMVKAFKKEGTQVDAEPFSLPWEDTAPASEPVNAALLFDKMFELIRRFTVCDLPYAYAATLWCGMTWLMSHLRVAPFAMITAPVLGCGKTVMLEVMAQLSYRSLFAASCSEAVLFRVIDRDHVSIFLDECDRAISQQRQELIGTLNASYTRRTASALRCVGEEIEPRSFCTWGAKAFAGIGQLEDTMRSRSIVIEMRRKLPHEKIENIRMAKRSHEAEFALARTQLARFAADVDPEVFEREVAVPKGLENRGEELWATILRVAELAGGEWPKRGREAALHALARQPQAASGDEELLQDVYRVYIERKQAFISTSDLITALCADAEAPWATFNRGEQITPRQLAKKLAAFGGKPIAKRQYAEVVRGYARSDLADAFSRYNAEGAAKPIDDPGADDT